MRSSCSTGLTPSPHTLCSVSPSRTCVVPGVFSADLAFLLRVRLPTFISKIPRRSRPAGKKTELTTTDGGFWCENKCQGSLHEEVLPPCSLLLASPFSPVQLIPSSATEQSTEAQASTLAPRPPHPPLSPPCTPPCKQPGDFMPLCICTCYFFAQEAPPPPCLPE